MPIRRRPDHRGHRNGHDNAPDHLDDLRALLPEEFRNAPDGEIAQLWLAWEAARRGHGVNDLIKTYAVSSDIAARMQVLAGRGQRRPRDTETGE